ncbi:MAG: ribosomal RNA small subunit methyltransferase A [Armatimonadetes bacterium]|nr:ribosomal RNA small subunit methyltransferase A [Armatimonadota bacterium]
MAQRLKKRLGQHLLTAPGWLERIVATAAVQPGDGVLEIGPGPGNLTRLLADAVGPTGRVLALELDTDWKPRLEALCASHPQVSVLWCDALEADLDMLDGWRVVANIPYYITAPLVEKLLVARARFTSLALLMQKEVALRLHAQRGREVGAISYFVHYHCATEVALTVPAEAFTPPPKVDSALLLLRPLEERPVAVAPERLFPLIRAAFETRRKMLRGSLRGYGEAIFRDSGVAGDRRPEDLTLEEFARLASASP